MATYRTENWIGDGGNSSEEYVDYWNDETLEKDKVWNILDGDFGKMESYLDDTGLRPDLEACVRELAGKFGKTVSGTGLDLAAGNLWAAPVLLQSGKVEKLYCLEYSRHRILTLGPKVLEHYGVPEERVVLVLGSFYDLRIEESSADFVFLSQAFHHAGEPDRLLAEIRRVVKPGGVVIIIGEHRLSLARMYVKRLAESVLARILPGPLQQRIFHRNLSREFPTKRVILAPDPVAGDHYYTSADYRAMFERHGFTFAPVSTGNRMFQSFVLFG